MICDFAEQLPGPLSKTYPNRKGRGAVLHSAEGYETGMWKVLSATAVLIPDTRVSWHFSVMLDGRIFQHYDTSLCCWHAHAAGNSAYVGIEHEGVAGTQETDAQVEADVKLLGWLDEGPWVRRKTLWEHREIVGNNTQCPSGRIRWNDILVALYPPPPPDPLPDYKELAAATASAVHFLRNGFNLADLIESDKALIRSLANHVG